MRTPRALSMGLEQSGGQLFMQLLVHIVDARAFKDTEVRKRIRYTIENLELVKKLETLYWPEFNKTAGITVGVKHCITQRETEELCQQIQDIFHEVFLSQ